MEYFGFTILFQVPDDVPVVIEHLKVCCAWLLTPQVQISQWNKDSIGFNDLSPHFPQQVWFDGIPKENKNWGEIYRALESVCSKLLGRLIIEYQDPERPTDPYFMLVFDTHGISLGDDSQWDETLDVEILETNYSLERTSI